MNVPGDLETFEYVFLICVTYSLAIMNRVSTEEIELLHLISEFTFTLHDAMEQPIADEFSFIWVEQMIEDIERGVVTLDENHLIDPSNVV